MELEPKKFYKFLGPRPAVLLTTTDKEKSTNATPISFVMPLSIEPPMIAVSIGVKSVPASNLHEIREFVINVMPEKMIGSLWSCTKNPPTGIDELTKAGLTQIISAKSLVPSIQEAIAWFECLFDYEKAFGDHVLVVGRVVHMTVRDDVLAKDGSIDLKKAGALMHMVGNKFAVAEREIAVKEEKPAGPQAGM